MKRTKIVLAVSTLLILAGAVLYSQSDPTQEGYTSVALERANSASGAENNDNYLMRNPFWFEGRVDYELLKVDTPTNFFEWMQYGISLQDEEDYEGAIEAYRTALSMNDMSNGTCQIIDATDLVNGALPRDINPPPCNFTLRLRLAYIIHKDEPEEAIRLFNEVLEIDPFRLDVNLLIGETWEVIAKRDKADKAKVEEAYREAIAAFNAELDLTPVPDPSISPDEATDALVHWLLAHLHEDLEEYDLALENYEAYLLATKWHSDVLPWRIPIAEHKVEEIRGILARSAAVSAPRQAPARAR